jgi:elongation factor P
MANVTELRPGNYFVDENNLYQVLDILLNKTAMRKMVAKVKVKNLRSGAVTELARNSGYDVEVVKLDKRQMQYLYDDGVNLVFMDQENYEQISLSEERLKWEKQFLKGNETIEITSYNDEILGINLPAHVALKVTECEPSVRGDTINKAMKEATLETGLKIKIPMFIEQGETIYVRTDNAEYDGRANS